MVIFYVILGTILERFITQNDLDYRLIPIWALKSSDFLGDILPPKWHLFWPLFDTLFAPGEIRVYMVFRRLLPHK